MNILGDGEIFFGENASGRNRFRHPTIRNDAHFFRLTTVERVHFRQSRYIVEVHDDMSAAVQGVNNLSAIQFQPRLN